jgi:hypothetical protein
MTVRPKAALPLCVAATVLLGVTGCHFFCGSDLTPGSAPQDERLAHARLSEPSHRTAHQTAHQTERSP